MARFPYAAGLGGVKSTQFFVIFLLVMRSSFVRGRSARKGQYPKIGDIASEAISNNIDRDLIEKHIKKHNHEMMKRAEGIILQALREADAGLTAESSWAQRMVLQALREAEQFRDVRHAVSKVPARKALPVGAHGRVSSAVNSDRAQKQSKVMSKTDQSPFDAILAEAVAKGASAAFLDTLKACAGVGIPIETIRNLAAGMVSSTGNQPRSKRTTGKSSGEFDTQERFERHMLNGGLFNPK